MLDNNKNIKDALNNIYEEILASSREKLQEEFDKYQPGDIAEALVEANLSYFNINDETPIDYYSYEKYTNSISSYTKEIIYSETTYFIEGQYDILNKSDYSFFDHEISLPINTANTNSTHSLNEEEDMEWAMAA